MRTYRGRTSGRSRPCASSQRANAVASTQVVGNQRGRPSCLRRHAVDATAFARWLDAQDAIGPKWRPRYVRILRDPPTTGTNKIVKRTLVHQKFRADRIGGDECHVRERRRDGVPAVHAHG